MGLVPGVAAGPEAADVHNHAKFGGHAKLAKELAALKRSDAFNHKMLDFKMPPLDGDKPHLPLAKKELAPFFPAKAGKPSGDDALLKAHMFGKPGGCGGGHGKEKCEAFKAECVAKCSGEGVKEQMCHFDHATKSLIQSCSCKGKEASETLNRITFFPSRPRTAGPFDAGVVFSDDSAFPPIFLKDLHHAPAHVSEGEYELIEEEDRRRTFRFACFIIGFTVVVSIVACTIYLVLQACFQCEEEYAPVVVGKSMEEEKPKVPNNRGSVTIVTTEYQKIPLLVHETEEQAFV